MKIILCLTVIGLILCVGLGVQPKPVAAASSTYFVATTGNDSNPGTLAQPWLTIQHAANTAIAGDTVNIEGGTYSSTEITFINSGSAGNYITFQNYNSGTVNVNITSGSVGLSTNGKSYLQIIGLSISASGAGYYGIDAVGGSYIVFKNLDVTNTRASGIYSEGGCTYLTVDSCVVHGTNTTPSEEMISITNTSHFEVKNCIVHDSGSSQRIAIDMKEGCSNGLCYNNTIYNATSNGIYIDARGTTSNINIYGNLIYNCAGDTGIAVNDENGNSAISNINIYNNIIWNCNSAFTVGHTGTETYNNVWFINNTCYNNENWYGYEIEIGTNPTYLTNCIIRNNVIVETATAGAVAIYDPNNDYGVGKLSIDHNVFYNTTSGGWAGSVFGTNYLTSNPLLTNPTTDFTLQVGSPAIDAGSTTNAPSIDYVGTARPQGSGYDIGAYEYKNSSPATLSITTGTLPNGTIGVAYSQTLVATGGTNPYTWTIVSGTLPAGLSITSSGVISGTPTIASGPNALTFLVTDNASTTATKSLSITVVNAAWDVNKDGAVNVQDMISISQHWGESGTPGWITQDVNDDGVINTLDMIIIGQHWTG